MRVYQLDSTRTSEIVTNIPLCLIYRPLSCCFKTYMSINSEKYPAVILPIYNAILLYALSLVNYSSFPSGNTTIALLLYPCIDGFICGVCFAIDCSSSFFLWCLWRADSWLCHFTGSSLIFFSGFRYWTPGHLGEGFYTIRKAFAQMLS